RMQRTAEAVVLRQRTAIENRIAFAPRRDKAGLGQHLEVMADAGLADGEDLRQFQYTERIAAEHPQHVQAQRIAAGLAQRGELVAVVETNLGHAQAHKRGSLDSRFWPSKVYIKKS